MVATKTGHMIVTERRWQRWSWPSWQRRWWSSGFGWRRPQHLWAVRSGRTTPLCDEEPRCQRWIWKSRQQGAAACEGPAKDEGGDDPEEACQPQAPEAAKSQQGEEVRQRQVCHEVQCQGEVNPLMDQDQTDPMAEWGTLAKKKSAVEAWVDLMSFITEWFRYQKW